MRRINFKVVGRPATSGSHRVIPLRGGKGHRLTHANPRLAEWKYRVALAAREAYTGELLNCPVDLRIFISLRRPKSHYGTGRNCGVIRASAPLHPTGKPDLDKLDRAIQDALTGVILRDDSIICWKQSQKAWGNRDEVEITIITREREQ